MNALLPKNGPGHALSLLDHRFSIIDDDPIVAHILELMLKRISFECEVQAFQSAETALLSFRTTPPQVVLLDVRLRGKSGLQCASELIALYPRVRIIIVTAYPEHTHLVAAIASGVVSYLIKPLSLAELHHALVGVLSGKLVISNIPKPAFSEPQAITTASPLTPRESSIMHLVKDGLKDTAIASELSLSVHTVKWHMKRILRKLRASCRTHAVALLYGSASFLKSPEPSVDTDRYRHSSTGTTSVDRVQ